MKKKNYFVRGFPERLKETMKARKMSYAELARRIGCDKRTIHNWIDGTSCPDIVMTNRICKSLNVTADYLIIGKKE